jgi:integrase
VVKKALVYGEGSIYQRASDGLWMGSLEAGVTQKGTRRRITVSGKTRAEVERKLRDRRRQIKTEGIPAVGGRVTVKTWAPKWLEIKRAKLKPKAYNAAASAVNKWIVPTIGHRKLADLNPADVRNVARAQRDAGLKGATAHATHRTLMNMLRGALIEGYDVPQRVFLTPAPTVAQSDRMNMPIDQALACLAVAAELPHGARWAVALLHGMRQGECLGLTWDAIDFGREVMTVEWQLQAVPYVDRTNKALGFRVPDDFDARHLIDSWHLVRPKSRKGFREVPLIGPIREALLLWREIAPENPWGLVWPATNGRPANNKHDLHEWHALQGAASVVVDPADERLIELGPIQVGHPAGRYFHVHECRNLTATQLDEAGASENVITSLLGHASIVTSRGYMRVDQAAKREALERVAGVLGIGPLGDRG